MDNARLTNAKKNIYIPLICQIVNIVCGLVLPRIMLKAYGSEEYGAVGSISHFLSYIAIIEGGIGGVARAALYKPLADNDIEKIGGVVQETEHFFRTIAVIFVAYTLIIACFFNQLSHLECFNWAESFTLVIIIAASTFAQYFFGITYCILLNAAQKVYLVYRVSTLCTVFEAAMSFILIKKGCSLHIVKLVSALVFISKPIILCSYAKKQFQIKRKKYPRTNLLTQKWTGLGQHLAYFFHTNTDVVVLTLFLNLKIVAVYTVYNMVVSQIQSLISSFTSGMESVFGNMLAKNEIEDLKIVFSRYNTLTSSISTVLLGCTATLIVPFVRIYTKGINDINYIRTTFGLLLVIASYIYCIRIPYHNLIIAAGHFKQTKFAAYGEAIINVGLSIILVKPLGLVGVAIGTVIATLFRMLYYSIYLMKNIICLSLKSFARRQCINIVSFSIILLASNYVSNMIAAMDYFQWILNAFVVTFISVLVVCTFNILIYKDDVSYLFKRILKHR